MIYKTIIFVLIIFFNSCSTEYKYIKQEIPDDFLNCKEIKKEDKQLTNQEFAYFILDLYEAYQDCKAKIKAINYIQNERQKDE